MAKVQSFKNLKNEVGFASPYYAAIDRSTGKVYATLVLGYGKTSRSIHQGWNGWLLARIDGRRSQGALYVGQYDGYDKFISGVSPKDLIPISKEKWEEIRGEKIPEDHKEKADFFGFNGPACYSPDILDESEYNYYSDTNSDTGKQWEFFDCMLEGKWNPFSFVVEVESNVQAYSLKNKKIITPQNAEEYGYKGVWLSTDTSWVQGEDLVPIGTYGQWEEVFTQKPISKGIRVFAPLYDGGPMVLVGNGKIAFVSEAEVVDTISGWDSFRRWREIEIPLIRKNEWEKVYDEKYTLSFYNPDHYKGVRITRFIKYLVDPNSVIWEPEAVQRCLESNLGIYQIDDYYYNFHRRDKFAERRFKVSEVRSGQVKEILGWVTEDGRFWVKRRGEQIQVVVEVPRNEFSDGRYAVEGTKEWLDYEENFDLIDWYQKPIDEWKKYLQSKLLKKARYDYVAAKKELVSIEAVGKEMESSQDEEICLEDSYSVGNCVPGTQSFLEKYGIKVEDECTTIGALLKNEHIDEMLKNFDFRKTIATKLA